MNGCIYVLKSHKMYSKPTSVPNNQKTQHANEPLELPKKVSKVQETIKVRPGHDVKRHLSPSV